MHSLRDLSSSANKIGQVGYRILQAYAVEQIVPERDSLFFTSFFQTGEGIPTSPALVGTGTAADLAFDDVFTDITITEVVV